MGLPALGLSLAGGVVGGLGKIMGGEAAADAANYRAQVAENNAIIARYNAESAAQTGELDVGRQGMRARANMGAIRAGMGASGVSVNSGSYADVQSAAAELAELDALTIRSDAARKAYGYTIEEKSQKAQADLYRAEGENARRAGLIGGFGSMLSSAGSVLSQGWKGQQRGMFFNG